MKKLFLYIAATLCITVSSCNSDDVPVIPPENKPQLQITLSASEAPTIVSTNNFGFRLFETICNKIGDENVFFSPLVSSLNLSLLANGAAGDTRTELLNALGVDDSQIAALNSTMNKLITVLPDADNQTNLTLASSIWLSDKCNPTITFQDICKDTYKASLKSYPFNSPSLASDINHWCSDTTNGVIKQLVNQNEVAQSNFNIVNAALFSSKWSSKFNHPTTEEIFYTTNYGERKVQMMHDNEHPYVTTTDKLSMLINPFGNSTFKIAFLLPHEDVALNDAISSLDSETWLYLLDSKNHNKEPYNITLAVPKLDIFTEYDMLSYYPDLGIESVQTKNANFSELGTDASLSLSRQKAQFKMDEKGAEAVAAQISSAEETSPGPPNWTEMAEFRLDRPFAFLIYENSTKTIVFAGKIEKP